MASTPPGQRSLSSPGEFQPLCDHQYQMSPSPLSSPLPDNTTASPMSDFESKDCHSATLTFKSLKVRIRTGNGESRVVLDGVTGVAEACNLLAILGPSGSGKTVLLDTLSGRLTSKAVLEGQILLNGRRQQLTYGTAAYVTDEDVLLGTLTVKETLYLSAHLRLPDCISNEQKLIMTETAMADMGLKDCESQCVGRTVYQQGLSKGQKRRLSIALELLMRPTIIYLDNPTADLDSASALLLMAKLKNLALKGKTVLATLQNCNAQSFELIDNLCLLARGKLIYFGRALFAAEHFARVGYECRPGHNAPEHFLLTLDPQYADVKSSVSLAQEDLAKQENLLKEDTKSIVQILAAAYTNSPTAVQVSSQLNQLVRKKGAVLVSNGRHASFFQQIATLTHRSILNSNRSFSNHWAKLSVSVLLMLVVGTIFQNIGYSSHTIQERISCIFIVLESMMLLFVVGGYEVYFNDVKLYFRERLNPHYGAAAFVWGSTCSSFPFLLLIAVVSSCVVYFLAQLHSGFEQFGYFVISLFLSLVTVESIMITASVISPSPFWSLTYGTCFQMLSMLVAGYFRLLHDLPKTLWKNPSSYISFHTYALRGMTLNELQGMQSNALAPSQSGDAIFQDLYQMRYPSKWRDLLVLGCFSILYRIILFIAIRVYQRFQSSIKSFSIRQKQRATRAPGGFSLNCKRFCRSLLQPNHGSGVQPQHVTVTQTLPSRSPKLNV